MTTIANLISEKCPTCRVALFRGATSVAADTVFCAECGRAGIYEEVIKNGKPLASGVFTRPQIDDILRDLGITKD